MRTDNFYLCNFDKEDDDGKKEIGAYLRELRLKRGLTLNQIADKLDISTNYVSQLERGVREVTDKLLVEFSKLYKTDEDILFWNSGKIPLGVRKLILQDTNLQKFLSNLYKYELSPQQERSLMIEVQSILGVDLE